MKSIAKIISRNLISAGLIAILLFALNLSILFGFMTYLMQIQEMRPISNQELAVLADNLRYENGTYTLPPQEVEKLKSAQRFAMLLDDTGHVVWSLDLPAEIPQDYTLSDVAAFSHWYLQDYPVYSWKHSQGLLVVGIPKGIIWKYNISNSITFIEHVPLFLLIAILLNIGFAILLAVFLGFRLFRSLRILAQGIEDLAEKKPVSLENAGILNDLAYKINQTSTELQKQQQILKKRDTARTNWISGVSHDIRTPLTMIIGYANQIEENNLLPPSTQKQAEIIKQQSLKIKQLISDLNLTSKLEYDMQPLRLSELYLSELLRQVIADFLNNCLEERFPIELTISEKALRCRCLCDRELLKRAFQNLLQNSMDHNPSGCHIAVHLTCDEKNCQITFADDGKGFPASVLTFLNQCQHTSDLFSETDRPHGLGTIIVKQIITSHGGNSCFANNQHGGCHVVLTIPCLVAATKT